MSATHAHHWSQAVPERSDGLDLEPGVVTWSDPARLTRSLAASSEGSGGRRDSEGLGAVALAELGLQMPGVEQRLGQTAQLLDVVAAFDGPRLGFERELAAQGQGVEHRGQREWRNATNA